MQKYKQKYSKQRWQTEMSMQSVPRSGKRRAAIIIAATLSLIALGGCYYAHTDGYYYGGSPGYRHGGYGYGGYGYRDYRGHHGHYHHGWRHRGDRW
jgi:hypothetical protein